MQRLRIELGQIAEHANLLRAAWLATRSRQRRPAAARLLADLDARLDALGQRIRSGQAPVGEQRQFVIHDPKRRLITAACLDDRVLHHAILNLAGPRFEQALVASSYACRPGKGVHAAVAALQQQLRRAPWAVQVDVDGYFPSIPHAPLLDLLARRFKGPAFLALLARIVAAGAAPGATQGLPIGALTSQHFANAYLGSADRLLLAHPGVAGQVRYMDDIAWLCHSRDAAQDSLAALREHLHSALGLRLKAGVVLRPSAQGLAFCGFRVRPGVVLAGHRKLRRYRAAVLRLQAGQAAGHDEADLQRAHDAALAALAGSQTLHWRRGLWADAGVPPQAVPL